MKKVKFDNIKYINYNITQTNQNVWYNNKELQRMNSDFLREITVISYLHNLQFILFGNISFGFLPNSFSIIT